MSFDRNAFARAVWLAYTTRRLTVRGQRLTATGYLLSRAMLRRARKGTGQLWPSRCTLAMDLGISDRTVQRQHEILRGLGLLTWQTRRNRRCRRDTNLYALVSPELKRTRESICDSSGDILSDGGRRALERLAAWGGGTPGDLLGWLSPGGAGESSLAPDAR
ncbi:helix-turn-helix domain-containing protein [Teichococcus vastitatis]|uniref:helix-turn-helix domain-containing protein n=1 Tax=Teichococcus vastitatis TaxID=2307076 RepID=UPI0013009246|nr:helix-turn-helix domain-containing protein [Pseudoroseomonas vastitatis]